jgi:hypothetical protein
MLTLAQLAEKFPTEPLRHNPSGCVAQRLTGRIPIAYYEQHEQEIRAARKAARYPTRIVFRGPRPSQYAQDTRREDAVSAIIYSR